MFEEVFGSKLKAHLLQLFFTNPEKKFYTQEIINRLKSDSANTHRELLRLLKLNIIKREILVKHKYYSVDKSSQYFEGFKKLFEDNIGEFHKENFFPTGTTQTAAVYFQSIWSDAISSVGSELGLVNVADGVARFWISKEGVLKQRDLWFSKPLSEIKVEYKAYIKKWDSIDDRLYQIASKNENSLEAWEAVAEFNRSFWIDSYKLECLDPFADQIEEKIVNELTKAGIDKKELFDMISPAELTVPQQREFDLLKIKNGKLPKKSYIRKYWYSLGTWNGGRVFSEKDLDEDLKNLEKRKIQKSYFTKLKKLQKTFDKKLNLETRNLVNLVRLFTLWREERKAIMQKIHVAISSVMDQISDERIIDRNLLVWCSPEELDKIGQNPDIFRERFKLSSYIFKKDDRKTRAVTGIEAKNIIHEFSHSTTTKMIKGRVASSGLVSGSVRIILRSSEFHRFQEGEILVTSMTRPEFLPLMKKALAIITDEGGITSHAGIVSRELKKPCITGTKVATQVLKDGDQIEVNAETGEIKILS